MIQVALATERAEYNAIRGIVNEDVSSVYGAVGITAAAAIAMAAAAAAQPGLQLVGLVNGVMVDAAVVAGVNQVTAAAEEPENPFEGESVFD